MNNLTRFTRGVFSTRDQVTLGVIAFLALVAFALFLVQPEPGAGQRGTENGRALWCAAAPEGTCP